jgi:hypothetical protein
MAMAVKNYPGPFNRDFLHRPLCKDSDKIPEGGTSTYILHLSDLTLYDADTLPAAKGGKVQVEEPEEEEEEEDLEEMRSRLEALRS